MKSLSQFLIQQQKYNNLFVNNNIFRQQNLKSKLYNKNYYSKSSGLTDLYSSTDADSLTSKNNNSEEIHIILKSPNNFVNELFKQYNEDNCLCNYLLFKKKIEINMNIEEKEKKKITLFEYFNLFKDVSFLCLNVPYLEKKGNIIFNIFNPTLSSMILLIKSEKIFDEKINNKYMRENFNLYSLPKDYVKIEFDEINPPYNRDIIDSKIKIIHEIIGKKRITLDKIDKDKSYFCVLWTPADTYKLNTSFLSYYSFNFELIGILIIKRNDYKWFTSFSNNIKSYKDFKKGYLNNVSKVETFLKKGKNINLDEKKFFSQDYKQFIYNS